MLQTITYRPPTQRDRLSLISLLQTQGFEPLIERSTEENLHAPPNTYSVLLDYYHLMVEHHACSACCHEEGHAQAVLRAIQTALGKLDIEARYFIHEDWEDRLLVALPKGNFGAEEISANLQESSAATG